MCSLCNIGPWKQRIVLQNLHHTWPPKEKRGQTTHQPKWYTKQEHAKMNQRVQDHAYIRARKNVKGMEIELMKKKEKKMGLLTGVK
jgi:hypothetical protein